jgi:hypothetical protein
MLRRLRTRLDAETLTASLEQRDLFEHRAEGYDWVAANFVLNVFAPSKMRAALEHLVGRLGDQGRLVIADFAPPSGGTLARLLAHSYYWPVDVAASALGLAALHPIYDYARELAALGLQVERRQRFGLYETLVTVPSRARRRR